MINKKRMFMGIPVRFTVKSYWPYKMDAKEFLYKISKDNVVFLENMEKLKMHQNELYVEQWMEIFLAWMEIENES